MSTPLQLLGTCITMLLLLLLSPGVSPASPSLATMTADIVVVGGTPGGVGAAIGARRGSPQAAVVLVERAAHIGGMTSGGLGWDDVSNQGIYGPTDIYSDFSARILAYYKATYGADSRQVRLCNNGQHHEPHVAELVFRQMLAEANVTLLLNSTLIEASLGAAGSGAAITAITLEQQQQPPQQLLLLRAGYFLDATYEGDLLAMAGVPYTVGRESRQQYGELDAGRVFQEYSTHTFLRGSSGAADQR